MPRRPRLMGVVNVTPDSFSDGGRFLAPQSAIDQALRLIEEGADLIDLGAESTRPGGSVYGAGAQEVEAREELARLLPVLSGLRRQSPIPISVDTRKALVARAALDAGADLLNDVSGLEDPETATLAARTGCPVVLMHHQGIFQRPWSADEGRVSETPGTLGPAGAGGRLVEQVRAGLAAMLARALAAGCRREQIVLDPGLGFGKLGRQNLELLGRLGDPAGLAALGRPILVGASRKSFLASASAARHAAPPPPPAERLPESLAAAAWAAAGGAAILRVHDVGATRRFLAAWTAIDDCGTTAGNADREEIPA